MRYPEVSYGRPSVVSVRDVNTRRVVLLVRSRQEGSKPLAERHLDPLTKENLALSN